MVGCWGFLGRWLASAGDAGMVYLWEIETGRREALLDVRSPTTVAIGPAGRQVAFAWTDGEQGRLRVQGLPQSACGPAFSACVGLALFAAYPQDEWWDFDIPADTYPARSLKRAVKWFKDNW